MPALLEVQNLKVIFTVAGAPVEAVSDISFSLKTSEFLGIVGESGSGKSVTALTLMRLIPASSNLSVNGEVYYAQGGKSVNLLNASEKEMMELRGNHISMVFQEPMTSLNPVYPSGIQVGEVLSRHTTLNSKQIRDKVLDLFREVSLPRPSAIYKAYPHELSGGQKQRIMIAMAIACNPDILIADEPTTALDVTVQQSILNLIKSLQIARQMAVIFITHDLGLVQGYADRVLVMYRGKIIEQGKVDEVFNRPVQPYTKGLLACRPGFGKKSRRLPTVQDFLSGSPFAEKVPENMETEKVIEAVDILRVECLSKYYYLRNGGVFRQPTKIEALQPVSFSVKKGSTLGIVGESGSGKTTLARTLLDLVPPSSGKVFFRDIEITGMTRKQYRRVRKEIQIIFQDPYASLNPRISVGRAIMEPMRFHRLHQNEKIRRERAEYLLQKVGLEPDLFYRYPHEFSGGQRQRVCIARALAVEPDLLICDESVSALDVSVQAQVLNLLNDLKEEFGLTYIFISHDLAVVKYMSDQLMVMKNGEVVEYGGSDAIFGNPGTAYTRSLLDAIPGRNWK